MADGVEGKQNPVGVGGIIYRRDPAHELGIDVNKLSPDDPMRTLFAADEGSRQVEMKAKDGDDAISKDRTSSAEHRLAKRRDLHAQLIQEYSKHESVLDSIGRKLDGDRLALVERLKNEVPLGNPNLVKSEFLKADERSRREQVMHALASGDYQTIAGLLSVPPGYSGINQVARERLIARLLEVAGGDASHELNRCTEALQIARANLEASRRRTRDRLAGSNPRNPLAASEEEIRARLVRHRMEEKH